MKRCAIILLVGLASGPAFAAEGMWQPSQLPAMARQLEQAGLEIDPSSLSRLTEHPMNAVIDLAGCTASFVSPQGLVITNHHCSWGSLQYNSSEERNLLDDGFLAENLAAELPAAPGSRVRVTVDVREVTDKVTKGLGDSLSGAERYQRIEDREKKLIRECEKDEGHRCKVQSFYGGQQFFLVKQLDIRDVRLVYAPPGSIGVFGGDIDNWMWPRHTGDYSFLRAYVGPDGKPADHAADNVPFKPKHWLRVAPGGVSEDGFVMVAGYPGRTNRYRLASEVANAFEWSYPTLKEMFDRALAIIDEQAELHPAVEIAYASTVAGLNNASKNFQGMLDGYAASGMLERKLLLERSLEEWIDASDERRREHGSTPADLEQVVLRVQSTQQRDAVMRRISRSTMLSTARQLYRLSRELDKPDAQREPGYQERDMTGLRQRLQRIDRRYHPEADKAIWRMYLGYYTELPMDQRIPELDLFLGLDDSSGLDAKLDRMYADTQLDESETRMGLIGADRATIEASEDPFLQLAVAMYDGDRAREDEDKANEGDLQLARSRYMDTMKAFLASRGRTTYADANGSLRVTYGKVRGYSPRDGMLYTPFTRLEGILEKYTGEEPFESPPKQLERIEAGDYGAYELESLGSVPVNFLSTVDTTGGNSGSPTLNGRGELVGLLFDGTYDSINADWDFNEKTTRSIHVDIRYVLWVMQKVDGASRVLEELGL